MSYRTRTIVAVVIIELMLAGFYLFIAGLPASSPDAARERGEVVGMVMGVILALSPLLYLMARKNDQRKAEKIGD